MVIDLKWPSKVSNRQFRAVEKGTNQLLTVKKESQISGIFAIIFFILTFLYIYISGAANSKEDYMYLQTLSHSFQNSEKTGPIILLLIFLATLQIFLSYQGFSFTGTSLELVTLIINYMIAICFLLFLFIYPLNRMGGVSIFHYIIAFFTIFFMTTSCVIIYLTYLEYYTEESLKPLLSIVSVIISMSIITIMTFIVSFSSYLNKKFGLFVIASAEIISIIMYVVFLCIIVNYPPIPKASLECTMVPQ